MRRYISLILLVTVLSCPSWAEEIAGLYNLGYVVVSPNGPDDGGADCDVFPPLLSAGLAVGAGL